MVQASATVAYIAAVANRFSYTADVSPESLVAFGSHTFISLWNLHDEKINATLPGHEGVVTCLRFVSEDLFVSGDDNAVVRCWQKSGSQVTSADVGQNFISLALPFQWSPKQKIQAHGKSIYCMTYYEGYLITGSSDSTVKVWTVD